MKRPKKFFLLFLLPMIFLIGAIINISFIKGSQYANLAANQRTKSVSQRGVIADRHMIPFTGYDNRYGKASLARHIIGYTDTDGKGISGIEKAFESKLSEKASVKNITLTDAEGHAIPSFKAEAHSDGTQYVNLTLDYHIQKIAENVLDEFGITGAAVVLDVESFDVLAMASRPDFDQTDVESHVSKGSTELLNRATAQYNAGSVFKIITAAAAIEEGLAENFSAECTGSMLLDGIVFPCHTPMGHGVPDMHSGFSNSCNCTFYQLGTALGSDLICTYSRKFGLGEQLLGGTVTESGGNIPRYLSRSLSEAANLSIGQGEIMITPLQAARTACIIASGGIAKEINIACSITGEDGKIIKNLRKPAEDRIISEKSAHKIGEMMLSVTTEGTGKNAYSELISIAGKTGSAETGWKTDEGCMVQGWFVGYFPYENPRYAMAIMTENGRQGNISCAPIFKEIAERIIKIR